MVELDVSVILRPAIVVVDVVISPFPPTLVDVVAAYTTVVWAVAVMMVAARGGDSSSVGTAVEDEVAAAGFWSALDALAVLLDDDGTEVETSLRYEQSWICYAQRVLYSVLHGNVSWSYVEHYLELPCRSTTTRPTELMSSTLGTWLKW